MPTILTVHGTFASGPEEGEKWWQKGSPVEDDLRRLVECEEGDLKFEPVIWDGHNSETSRRAAGNKLLTRMLDLEKQDEDYSVVGHSHGGSVIASALAEASARGEELPHLNKWITVGTPFIEMEKERFLFSRLTFIGKAAYISFVTMPFLVMISILAYWSAQSAFVHTPLAQSQAVIEAPQVAGGGAGRVETAPQPATGAGNTPQQNPNAATEGAAPESVEELSRPGPAGGEIQPPVPTSTSGIALITTMGFLLFVIPFVVLYLILRAANNYELYLHSPTIQQLTNARFIPRWVPLYHQGDEAINGLGAVEHAKPSIFARDFAVPIISMLTVFIIPIAIAILASWPSAMVAIHDALLNANSEGTQSVGITDANGKLVGRGENFATNVLFIALLAASPAALLVGAVFSEAFLLPIAPIIALVIVFFVVPGIFFVISVAILYVMKLIAGALSRFLSGSLDELTWAQLRSGALGNDTSGELLKTASVRPMWAKVEPRPLPAEIDGEIRTFADKSAAEAIPKFRHALTQFALDETEGSKKDIVSQYLQWPELIHTAYFRVPRFRKLLVYAMAHTTGLRPANAFTADADFARVENWHGEISKRDATAEDAFIEPDEKSCWRWRNNDPRALFLIPVFFLLSSAYQFPEIAGFGIRLDHFMLPLAAAAGGLFGLSGMVATAFGCIPALYGFSFETTSGDDLNLMMRMFNYGSLGFYLSAVCLAFLFAQAGRAQATFAANDISTRQILVLAVGFSAAYSIPTFAGFNFSINFGELVFLVVFLLGLSQVPLRPIAYALIGIGVLSTLLFVAQLTSMPMQFWGKLYLPFLQPAIWMTLIASLFVGRGVALRAFNRAPNGSLERFAHALCSRPVLYGIVVVALLHWLMDIRLGVGIPDQNGWISSAAYLDPDWRILLPLAGFAAGLLYQRGAVIYSIVAFVLIGVVGLFAFNIATGTKLVEPYSSNVLSFLRVVFLGRLQWLGESGVFVACAFLGWAVAARTNSLRDFRPTELVGDGPPSQRRLLPQLSFGRFDYVIIGIGAAIWVGILGNAVLNASRMLGAT